MQLFSIPPQRQQTVAIPQDVPVYRIKEKGFYADDRLFEEGKIIVWHDEPSLCMEPLNKLAQQEMLKMCDRLDKEGEKAARKAGVAYVGYGDAMKNAMKLAQLDAKRVSVLNEGDQQRVLGAPTAQSRAAELQPEDVIPVAEIVNSGRIAVNEISKPELETKK